MRLELSKQHSTRGSLQAEALRVVDGGDEALPQRRLAAVLRQQQVVEARVRRGQPPLKAHYQVEHRSLLRQGTVKV